MPTDLLTKRKMIHATAGARHWSNNYSDVKFHEIFCREIIHEIFLKYFKNFTMFFRLYTHRFNIFKRLTLR